MNGETIPGGAKGVDAIEIIAPVVPCQTGDVPAELLDSGLPTNSAAATSVDAENPFGNVKVHEKKRNHRSHSFNAESGMVAVVKLAEEDSVEEEESDEYEEQVREDTVSYYDMNASKDEAPVQETNEEVSAAAPRQRLGLRICWLPVDSLHCIASFLTALDWANFGQTTTIATPICREVFHKVRLHGFRCATEVVTAWKLGQHADARELSALYIKSGVPIYPLSLRHSYHTMVWRMKVEAREMAQAIQGEANKNGGETGTEISNNNNNDGDEDNRAGPVDQFFADRYGTAQDGNMRGATYLEEKCLYQYDKASAKDSRFGSRVSLTSRANFAPPAPVLGPGAQGIEGWDERTRLPDFRPAGSPDTRTPSPLRSSPSEQHRPAPPKVEVKVHRHLVDQHLLGYSTVDDESGGLVTAPVSLAADFFHQTVGSDRSINGVMSSSTASSVTSLDDSPMQPTETGPTTVDLLRTPVMSASAAFPVTPTSSSPDLASRLSRHDSGECSGELHVPVDEPYPFRSHQLGTPEFAQISRSDTDTTPTFGTPLQQQSGIALFPPPPPPPVPTPDELSSNDAHNGDLSFFSQFDLDIYNSGSAGTVSATSQRGGSTELKSHLKTRFGVYQRRLETQLSQNDSLGFEECLLDFWDEFLPVTANIHYYDRHTAIPRISGLQKFLSKPCPKAIGTVQCEIERIRINPKKGVNMKRRLFPTYEYRLFIRDRRHDHAPAESSGQDEETPQRKDTVLMMAKNRGRKHQEASGIAVSKKGVNNYYLYMPQQNDVDTHYRSVNDSKDAELIPNGASGELPTRTSDKNAPMLLGRLQSNFIGTEFQIFTPSVQKRSARKPKPVVARSMQALSSDSESDVAYDSATSSENAAGPASRRGRNRFKRRGSAKPVLLRPRNGRDIGGSKNGYSHPQPIEEEDLFDSHDDEERPANKRSYSLPSFSYRKSSRSSRRAVANSVDSPESQEEKAVLLEEEDGAITYTANLLGNRPRIMDVCIPKIATDGSAGTEWKRFLDSVEESTESTSSSSSGNNSKMLTHFKQVLQRRENSDEDGDAAANEIAAAADLYTPPGDFGLLALQNRPPWWNMELNAFVLNFGGRVSVASVKNFQLCDRTDQDHIMLQFGRIGGRHAFTMDFQHPLTAVQAFAIAISSLQSRISFG